MLFTSNQERGGVSALEFLTASTSIDVAAHRDSPVGRGEEVHLTLTRVFRPRSHPEIATLRRFARSIDMQGREL